MRRASLSSVERLRWSVEIPSASIFIHSATWRNSVSSVVKLILLMSLGVAALSRPQRDHPSGVFHPIGTFCFEWITSEGVTSSATSHPMMIPISFEGSVAIRMC